MKLPTLKRCEKAIGEPAKDWAGRCYEISYKLVKAGIMPKGAEAVYGHWRGDVHRNSMFANRPLPFVQHGWIYVADEGLVIDPTRWVFEARKPYLYSGYEHDADTTPCRHCGMLPCEHDGLGANDECALYEAELWPYDEGGNDWRAATAIRKPVPKPKAKDERVKLKLSVDVALYVGALLGQGDGTKLTAEQIFWLANLSYQQIAGAIGPRAVKEIYEAICDAGSYYIEFIPLDNRVKAKREAGFSRT